VLVLMLVLVVVVVMLVLVVVVVVVRRSRSARSRGRGNRVVGVLSPRSWPWLRRGGSVGSCDGQSEVAPRTAECTATRRVR
jgi:hypothetical protein